MLWIIPVFIHAVQHLIYDYVMIKNNEKHVVYLKNTVFPKYFQSFTIFDEKSAQFSKKSFKVGKVIFFMK